MCEPSAESGLLSKKFIRPIIRILFSLCQGLIFRLISD